MSGLKVNFTKTMLVGVNICTSWLREAAPALRCKVENLSFLYLDLSIGGDLKHLGFLEPMVTRLSKILFKI
jgi:hypothetical protein